MNQLNELATKVKELLEEKNYTLATCESLTCGLIAATLGSVPGVSNVFAGGLVTYMTHEKHLLAGVKEETLDSYGAVASQTALEMAQGAAKKLETNCAVSATGNAGPSTMEGKPAGLVYIGVSVNGKASYKEYHFEGNRQSIREQSACAALSDLIEQLQRKDA